LVYQFHILVDFLPSARFWNHFLTQSLTQISLFGKIRELRIKEFKTIFSNGSNPLFPINPLPQNPGRLEHQNLPSPEHQILFGLRIPTPTSILLLQLEFPKTRDEQILTISECLFHYLKKPFHYMAGFWFGHTYLSL